MRLKRFTAVVLFACVMWFTSHEAQAFYNPSTGRWLSRDPIEEDGGVNLHGFVNNEATIRFDLDGKQFAGEPLGSGCTCVCWERIACELESTFVWISGGAFSVSWGKTTGTYECKISEILGSCDKSSRKAGDNKGTEKQSSTWTMVAGRKLGGNLPDDYSYLRCVGLGPSRF